MRESEREGREMGGGRKGGRGGGEVGGEMGRRWGGGDGEETYIRRRISPESCGPFHPQTLTLLQHMEFEIFAHVASELIASDRLGPGS